MSINYDKLWELLEEATPGPWEQAARGQIGNRELRMIVTLVGGDESGEQIGDSTLEADRELVALAPELARELLNLRERVEQVAGLLKRTEIAKDTAGDHAQANAYMYAHQHVTALLDGEHHDI